MCKVTMLRELMKQRLNLAVEEIYQLFERTIMEYEEELNRSKEEKERQGQILDAVLKSRAVEQHEEEDVKILAQSHDTNFHARKRKKLQPTLIKDKENAKWSGHDGQPLHSSPSEKLIHPVKTQPGQEPLDGSCVGYIAPLSDSEFKEPPTIKDKDVSITPKKEQLGSQSADKLTPPITTEVTREQRDKSTSYVAPLFDSDKFDEPPSIKNEEGDASINPNEELFSSQSVDKLTPPITTEDTGQQRDGTTADYVAPPSELDKIDEPKSTNAWNGQHGGNTLIDVHRRSAVSGQREMLTPSEENAPQPASDCCEENPQKDTLITCLLCLKPFVTAAHLIAHSKTHVNDKWPPLVSSRKKHFFFWDCRKKYIFGSSVMKNKH
ncbi:uncharacterized protein LOC144078831 [Stigmatopora argus]